MSDLITNNYIERLELKIAALEEINLELKHQNKLMKEFMEDIHSDTKNDTLWNAFLKENLDFELNTPEVIDEGIPMNAKFENFLNKCNQDIILNERDELALRFIDLVYREEDGTIESISEELGIDPNEYDPKVHWPMLLARRCYSWADAFIKERDKMNSE
jgi:hypothetical protein